MTRISQTGEDLLSKYSINYPECGFDVGVGWMPLVEHLIQALKELGWTGKLSQVKEKFGGLRFYCEDLTPEMNVLITTAEADSFKICEDCGQSGRIHSNSWIRTLCDKCYNDR